MSSLSFHSLINLKIQLEKGLLLLDFQANDMDHILKTLVEQWISIGLLENEQKNKVLSVLLKKHTHVDEESRPSMARQFSALGKNITGSSSTKSSKGKKQKDSFTAQGIQSAMMFSAMTTAGAAKIGKKHALKIYNQFTLNTSCFWGSTRSNTTPVVQFHEIFVTKLMNNF